MPNAYNVSLIASLLVLAIGVGVVFAWTRSLIPSTLTHAIINVPMTPPWQGVLLVVLVIGAAVAAHRAANIIKQVFSRASVTSCIALAVVGMSYAIAIQRLAWLVYAGAAMVVIAVGLEALDRSNRIDDSPGDGARGPLPLDF